MDRTTGVMFVAWIILSATACAHRGDISPVRATPPSVTSRPLVSDNDEWNRARRWLESQANDCEVRRQHLQDETDSAGRTARGTRGAVFVALEIASALAGPSVARGVERVGAEEVPVVGHGGGSSWTQPGAARCEPVAGPNLTAAPGTPAYATGCTSTASGSGGPIEERARVTRLDAETAVTAMEDALDAAYEWLRTHASSSTWSDEEAAEWGVLAESVAGACQRPDDAR